MLRKQMSAVLITLTALLPALAPVASAEPAGPFRLFLPVVFGSGAAPTQPSALFWAERYSLPEGGCSTLHWKTQGAYDVFLDGQRVGAQGTQEVCPLGTQFYTLEVAIGGPIGAEPGSVALIREVVLTAGEPFLLTNEVIAQGTISAIATVADVDPKTSGDQPGYRLDVKNINKLWAFNASWNPATASVSIAQEAIDLGEQGPVHWPLHVGQSVEFYAECAAATCLVDYMSWHYLYMTTE
jgi:hypothetical protein